MAELQRDLRVVPSEAVFPELAGNLNVKVCDDQLLICPDIYHRLEQIQPVRAASDLFLFLESFSEDVAEALGWAPNHIYLAHQSLAHLLLHYLVPEQISFPSLPADVKLPELAYVEFTQKYRQ
ncbi:hypothetical protein HY495_03695 [Candidatus Woesearchaeota archaeon]|nr:hypothetical protein [Candidatus Woesearchaeota archaeon]